MNTTKIAPRFVREVANYCKAKVANSCASPAGKQEYYDYVEKYVKACERGLTSPVECIHMITGEDGYSFE